MSSYDKLTNEQVLGRLSEAWMAVSQPKHWAHETSKTWRVLGNLNKIVGGAAGVYLGGKLVTNRRGKLSRQNGIVLGGSVMALGAYAWETIEKSFKNVLGNVPAFLKRTAMYDMTSGIEYALGRNQPPPVAPKYEILKNQYFSLRAEADARGILPLDHKYAIESPFGEHNMIQQSLATLATAAAVAIVQAKKAHPNYRLWQGKNILGKAIGVTVQEIEDMIRDNMDGGGDAGYNMVVQNPEDEEFEFHFGPAPNRYDNLPIPDYAGVIEQKIRPAMDNVYAPLYNQALEQAAYYAEQMHDGVEPGNVHRLPDPSMQRLVDPSA